MKFKKSWPFQMWGDDRQNRNPKSVSRWCEFAYIYIYIKIIKIKIHMDMKRAPRTVETAATKRIHWMSCCASQEKAAASSPVVLYVTALARCASVIPTSLAHTLTASATAAVALGTVALSPRPSSRPSRESCSRARRGRTGD